MAMEAFENCLKMKTQEYGPKSIELAEILGRIGLVSQELNDYDKAY
jgi:hypothetical protein